MPNTTIKPNWMPTAPGLAKVSQGQPPNTFCNDLNRPTYATLLSLLLYSAVIWLTAACAALILARPY